MKINREAAVLLVTVFSFRCMSKPTNAKFKQSVKLKWNCKETDVPKEILEVFASSPQSFCTSEKTSCLG